MLTGLKDLGDILRVAQTFKRSTESLEGRNPRISTTRTGKGPIESSIRAAVHSVSDTVEDWGEFTAQGLSPGNQRSRWHGTTRSCNVGDNGRTSLCYSPQCSLCCIIRTSFDITHSKKKTGWGRFGNGIYTSFTSSKLVRCTPIAVVILILFVSRSNDYSENLVPSPWKAVLLANVVVGNAKRFTTNQPALTRPPAGFDSVRLTFLSPIEILCDLSTGHWRAQPRGFSEL